MEAYLQHRSLTREGIEIRNINGELASWHFDSHRTESVPVKIAELPWQKNGLCWTATGYGARIPTRFMVKVNNVWRRVYCRIYSNIGTLFIGANPIDGTIVSIID
jgi:hypothetical protein